MENYGAKTMKLLAFHRALIELDAKALGRFTSVRFWLASAIRQVSINFRAFNVMVSEGLATPANAMLRMQLEVGARCNALFLVDDAESFCQTLLNGVQIRSLKDRNGRRCTDQHLFEKYKENNLGQWSPFLTKIHEVGCMHIHLSSAAAHRSLSYISQDHFGLRDLGDDDFENDSERASVELAMEVATLLAVDVIGQAVRRIAQPKPDDFAD